MEEVAFMSIVTFYRGDPKNAPKTTMPAHLGANAILGVSLAVAKAAAARLGELYNPEQMQERRLGIYRDILQRSDM